MSALAKIKAESDFITFKFGPHEIRVINKDGESWFVAKDVCDAIGLSNSRVSLLALDDDEKGVSSTYSPGGRQDLSVVILPAIRKTGSYHSSMISDLSFNG